MYWFVVWSFVAVFSYNYDAADANEMSNFITNFGDCYHFGHSQQYTGPQSTTIGGRICQRWNTDFPHTRTQEFIPKTSGDRNSNYCRDISNYGALWCYTTDPEVRWEICPVPVC